MKKKFFVLLSVFIFCMTLGLKEALAAPPATDVACKAPCINSFEIQDGQVTNVDIGEGAVTDTKITGPISASKIEKPANVITVAKSGGDFTSIQAAIDSVAFATNTYLIKVMPGTYVENLTLQSNVHLQGAGKNVTTITSPTASRSVVYIGGLSNVEISGFTIREGHMGIENSNSSSVMITDNIITGNNYFGIYDSSSGSTIRGNIISRNGVLAVGIGTATASPFIIDNVITENGGGGIVNYAPTAIIIRNWITDNGADIAVAASTTPNISFNVYNTISGDTGVGQYNVKSNGDIAPAP